MLSFRLLSQITPLQAKSFVEIALDSNGSLFRMNRGNPTIESLPGEFAMACRVAYTALQDIPISTIRNIVKSKYPGNYEDLNTIEEYRYFLGTQEFYDLIRDVNKSITKREEDAAFKVFGNQENIDRIIEQATALVDQLQGDTNIFMLYSRVSDTRYALRKVAANKRRSNIEYFNAQPDLYEALEVDYWEYLKGFMEMLEDDTLNMSKILGADRERIFYPVWFKEKFPKHLQGVTTVNYDGETLSTWQMLNTSFRQYSNIDLVDIMNRVIDVSNGLFAHGSAQNTPNDLSAQYSIYEYYIEKKLHQQVAMLNAGYSSVVNSTSHTVRKNLKPSKKTPRFYNLSTELGVGRRVSGTSTSLADSSFRKRVKNNKQLIHDIDVIKSRIGIENMAEIVAEIEKKSSLRSVGAMGKRKDSNRPHLEQSQRIDYYPLMYTPEGFNEEIAYNLGVDVEKSSVYEEIGKIVQCLCDLELLDSTLEKYHLSIVDMPPLDTLNKSYYSRVRTLRGLLNDMISKTSASIVSYDDGFGGQEVSYAQDSVVLEYIEENIERAKPTVALDEGEMDRRDSVISVDNSIPKVPVQEVDQRVFSAIQICRPLFNSMTQVDVLRVLEGKSYVADPYQFDLPMCKTVAFNGMSKIPGDTNANKAYAILVKMLQGVFGDVYDQYSSTIQYLNPEDEEIDIVLDVIRDSLMKQRGEFIRTALSLIPMMKIHNADFNTLFVNTDAMDLIRSPMMDEKVKEIYLGFLKYDTALERKHRKAPLYLKSMLNAIMAPENQAVSAKINMDYIGQELGKFIYPSGYYNIDLTECEDESVRGIISFSMSGREVFWNGKEMSDEEYEAFLNHVSIDELVLGGYQDQNSCLLFVLYAVFTGITQMVKSVISEEPVCIYAGDRFGRDFGSILDIFVTRYYTSLTTKAKINSIIYKLLPSLNQAVQVYHNVGESKDSCKHYHAIALLLNKSSMIHELYELFQSLQELPKFLDGGYNAVNRFNQSVDSIGIATYSNNFMLGDKDYEVFQMSVVCSAIQDVLDSDANDWVKMCRTFATYEDALTERMSNVMELKSIQSIQMASLYDSFDIHKGILMETLRSEKVAWKILTIGMNIENKAALTKFLSDKDVDAETGFVIFKNGTHYACRIGNQSIVYVHSSGLAFEVYSDTGRCEVYTLDDAINNWRRIR